MKALLIAVTILLLAGAASAGDISSASANLCDAHDAVSLYVNLQVTAQGATITYTSRTSGNN
jgi:hypothetical protein